MRYLFCLILWLWPFALVAQDSSALVWEDQQLFHGAGYDPDAVEQGQQFRILSSTDTSFFAPIIASYLLDHPRTSVEYLVAGTAEIDRIFRDSPGGFDLVISSAMDLQFKLTNDGYAQPISDLSTPEWAQWRHSLFAFTVEPAAIVINRAAFAGQALPQTRQELIEALRARPAVFRNRLGTYDIRQSGLGYLFATQDARASETYWRLMEVMGNLDTHLYCCSGEMIDDLASGEIAVAYNVLGSYAMARAESGETLAVVLPADFPTTMMRTGFVPRQAAQPDLAKAFMRHLLNLQSGRGARDGLVLPPLISAGAGPQPPIISLGPALMSYLDRLKRETFLQEWVSAVIQ
ncbi:ABC transporter substrate-binding protein [Pseudophaeobacter sp.]|uniref:ABC transporter substrate-binding protein n=1 Tax=Pseudophaeobacter sp. TaxID=1971739 RepID=UPI004059AFC5